MEQQYDAVDILLVEDNPRDAELTIRAFRKRNLANAIIHLEDGAAALDFMFGKGTYAGRNTDVRPKIILLDLKLPKIDGLEVLKQLKSNPDTHTIPIIVVTSSKEDPDVKMAYEYGANSYVVKPVDFESFQGAMAGIGLYWLLVNQHHQ
jgi:two-component system response regulator